MKSLLYSGGPMDGQSYPLEANQSAPLAIRKNEWRELGHYVLANALSHPYLKWVGK